MSSDTDMWDLIGRDLSTAVVLYHEAVAEQIGLNATDRKCLGILERMGPITAGQLSEAIGLTGGAITGVIDRLEQAGLVHREQDRKDRRRVIIHALPNHEHTSRMAQIFASLQQATEAQLGNRYSPQELSVIEDFLRRLIQVLRQETHKLKEVH